ncbi:hypothetical protein NL676_001360 [Syzygium grande]|nr:hypothetical protein NL676_001360 [Syzygium grande]
MGEQGGCDTLRLGRLDSLSFAWFLLIRHQDQPDKYLVLCSIFITLKERREESAALSTWVSQVFQLLLRECSVFS